MSILVRNSSQCPICGEVIGDNDRVTGFPAFVVNALDRMYIFDDAVVHTNCLRNHPLGQSAIREAEQAVRATRPDRRLCSICLKLINDPDDHLYMGYLTDADSNPLSRYNHLQVHRSCLRDWSQTRLIGSMLADAKESGLWKGAWLDSLIRNFSTAGAS